MGYGTMEGRVNGSEEEMRIEQKEEGVGRGEVSIL